MADHKVLVNKVKALEEKSALLQKDLDLIDECHYDESIALERIITKLKADKKTLKYSVFTLRWLVMLLVVHIIMTLPLTGLNE